MAKKANLKFSKYLKVESRSSQIFNIASRKHPYQKNDSAFSWKSSYVFIYYLVIKYNIQIKKLSSWQNFLEYRVRSIIIRSLTQIFKFFLIWNSDRTFYFEVKFIAYFYFQFVISEGSWKWKKWMSSGYSINII